MSDDLEFPETAVVNIMEEVQSTPSISKLISIERYSKYDMVIRVTARLLSVFERTNKVSLRNALVDPGQELIQKAESLWLHECQAEIKEQVRKGRFASLSPGIRDDGVVIVGSRVKKWEELYPVRHQDHSANQSTIRKDFSLCSK